MQDMAAQTIAQQQQPQKNQTRTNNFSALVDQQQTKKPMEEGQTARDLLTLYKQSLEEHKASIVPGNELALYHRVANYVASNPIRALAALAVPSVGLIFYGQTGQQHLQMSVKLLHTRVFGQFTTLVCKYLGLLGCAVCQCHCVTHALWLVSFVLLLVIYLCCFVL